MAPPRKDYLLEFIVDNVDRFTFLKVHVTYVNEPTEGYHTFGFTVEDTISYIQENFNDNLQGLLPGTDTLVEIDNWQVIDRPIVDFE